MDAITLLKQEHEKILSVLDETDKEVQKIESDKKIDVQKTLDLVDFIQNFADKHHHSKEEEILFKKMMERGMTGQNDPIYFMLQEHDQGRKYVRNILSEISNAKEGNFDSIQAVADNLKAYRDLLRVHINKENMILYPMAERLLSSDDLKELDEKFEQVENSKSGMQIREKFNYFSN